MTCGEPQNDDFQTCLFHCVRGVNHASRNVLVAATSEANDCSIEVLWHTKQKCSHLRCISFIAHDTKMKVYPVGTVQLIRPRPELGRQSARRVGIAGFSLSFCAEGFQRKRCQLFDRSMPTFGPGSFFAAVWALTSVLPWSCVQRDPFPSVPLVECHCHCKFSGPAPSACPEVPSSSTGWANSVVGGLGRRRWRGGIHLRPLRGGRPLGRGPVLPAGAAKLVADPHHAATQALRDREVRGAVPRAQWS